MIQYIIKINLGNFNIIVEFRRVASQLLRQLPTILKEKKRLEAAAQQTEAMIYAKK